MPKMTREEIAKILKNARIESGLTQKQAAEALGKKQQTLASWETAQSQPDANTLFLLCEIYGISADEAFGFKNKNNTNNLSKEEQNLIKKFRCLDDSGKETVEVVLNTQYKRCIGADREDAEFSEEIC